MEAMNMTAEEVFWFKCAMCTSYLTIGVLSTVGNALLAGAALNKGEQRTKSAVLLGCLALGDWFVGLNGFSFGFFYAAELTGLLSPQLGLCVLSRTGPQLLTTGASGFLTASLAIDRLLLLKKPMFVLFWRTDVAERVERLSRWYRALPLRRYVSRWLAGLGLILLFILCVAAVDVKDAAEGLVVCEFPLTFGPLVNTSVMPALQVSFAATVLLCSWRSIKAVGRLATEAAGRKAALKRRVRFQKSLRLVLYVYLLTWVSAVGLHVANQALFPAGEEGRVTSASLAVYWLQITLGGLNVCSNFFIYYWRNEDYRRSMRMTLGLKAETRGALLNQMELSKTASSPAFSTNLTTR